MSNLLASLSLLTAGLALSAFDLPVQLPSGQTFHLNVEDLRIDQDSYKIYMDLKIQDPEELRLFSEDSNNISESMEQSLEDEWRFHNFNFWLWPSITLSKLKFPSLYTLKAEPFKPFVLSNPRPINMSGCVVINYASGKLGTGVIINDRSLPSKNDNAGISGTVNVSSAPSPKGTLLLTSGSISSTASFSDDHRPLLGNNGSVEVSVGNTYTLTGNISSNNMHAKGMLLTPTISAENPISHCETNTDTLTINEVFTNTVPSLEANDKPIETILSVATERTDPSSSTAEEVEKNEVPSSLDTPVDNSQDNEKEAPIFYLSFSILGSDFGRGWRLTPYELRFVKKQPGRMENRDIKDDIEMVTLLVAPVKSELYQKQYASSDLLPFKDEPSLLTYNPDSTFTLRSTSQETFLFNPTGQLIHSLRSNGFSSTYNYFDGKLVAIHHADCPDLFFEYEGVKVTTIHGLPSTIHLEYDDQDHLCRIYDDQGSFLQISYDEDGDLYRITDDSDAILFKRSERVNRIDAAETIPLLFNGFGEVFYYKDSQNNLKISFKSWEDEDDE